MSLRRLLWIAVVTNLMLAVLVVALVVLPWVGSLREGEPRAAAPKAGPAPTEKANQSNCAKNLRQLADALAHDAAGRSTEMANQSNCAKNLRQLFLSLILWRDNQGKGKYPPLERFLTTLYTAGAISDPISYWEELERFLEQERELTQEVVNGAGDRHWRGVLQVGPGPS